MARQKKQVPLNKDTEDKLMAAAKNAFIKYGLEGARMQDIADEAGISKSMLHYYFTSKEKLFETIFSEAVNTIFSKLTQIFNSDETVMEKIARFSKEYIGYLADHPHIPLFILHESHKDPVAFMAVFFEPRNVTVSEKFVKQIKEEIREGNIRQVNPYVLIQQVISMSVFPIVAQPLFQTLMGLNDKQYAHVLKEHQKDMVFFFERSLKP
jgi:AcrR family transcriptional regulator